MLTGRQMRCSIGVGSGPRSCNYLKPSTSRRNPPHVCHAVTSPETNNVGNGVPVMDEQCGIFIEADGKVIKAMCCDYGFRSGAGRLYEERYGEVPQSVWEVGTANFKHEFQQMRRFFRLTDSKHLGASISKQGPLGKVTAEVAGAARRALARADVWLEKASILPKLPPPMYAEKTDSEECLEIRDKLAQLKLSNRSVAEREHRRELRDGPLVSPIWVKIPFLTLCWVLDVMYDNKPIQKFWVLEVVARIPYFACISILHLYETVGFWRAGAEIRKVHFAEEWNELHHLQIMETLGGDMSWFDRWIAEHSALLYYWTLIAFYLINPRAAYNFMQRVELHAFDTYSEFVDENADLLRSIPPPMVALNYYRNQDLFMFDAFQKAQKDWTPRRPPCDNLYDTFINIRDDEWEHVKTMVACQDESIARDLALQRGAPQRVTPRRL